MPYATLENTYKTLSSEQQMIVYNLVLSLYKLNQKSTKAKIPKRKFGKFANVASAEFSDDWEMTEEELCNL